jgi:hypothetical protein
MLKNKNNPGEIEFAAAAAFNEKIVVPLRGKKEPLVKRRFGKRMFR